MKTLRLVTAILIFVIVAASTSYSVRAENVSAILRKYNVGVEHIDTTELEEELSKAVAEYSRIETEYREKQSMIHTVDLTSRIMKSNIQANDINSASVDIQRKETYLQALVNVDADFEKIFEAEKEYRESQKQLGIALDISGILTSRLEALEIYSDYLPDTELSDVEQAEIALRSSKDKLTGAKQLADIGKTNNLSFPVNYAATVTSGFGIRKDPFGGSGTEFHYGLDLGAPEGTEITSLFNGVIAKASYDAGLGNYIVITHGKELQTLYAHLSEIKVNTGDAVKQGDTIGLVGSTGRSTGPHLHLGVYINGQKVDPIKLFAKG